MKMKTATVAVLLLLSAAAVAADDGRRRGGRGEGRRPVTRPFEFHVLLQGGDRIRKDGRPYSTKNLAFGQLIDRNGRPVHVLNTTTGAGIDPYQIANDPDQTAILKLGPGPRDIVFVVGFEFTAPSVHYVVQVEQDPETGLLEAIAFEAADWSAWSNVYALCAGSRSPWNTHLGAQESTPDAFAFEAATDWFSRGVNSFHRANARYWQMYFGINSSTVLPAVPGISDPINAMPADFARYKQVYSPYGTGNPVEVKVTKNRRSPAGAFPFSISTRKYYAWGRTVYEMPLVMPDRRTIYLMDDDGFSGASALLMFKADVDRRGVPDYDNGLIYAAKVDRQHTGCRASSVGCFDLSWRLLGRTNHAEVDTAIRGGITASQIMGRVEVPLFSPCPDATVVGGALGCGSAVWSTHIPGNTTFKECLCIRPGRTGLAVALETQRVSSLVGATREFSRFEGVTVDEERRMLYTTLTEVFGGMNRNDTRDIANGRDDIGVSPNPCGAVYSGRLNATWDLVTLGGEVAGIPAVDTRVVYGRPQTCDLDGVANPDNVEFLDGSNTLVIYEDTGTGHTVDYLWAYDVATAQLTRIATQMYGAEWTGNQLSECINGWKYLVGVIQHPYGETDRARVSELGASSGAAATVGYFPLRCNDFAPGAITSINFRPVPIPQSVDQHKTIASGTATFTRLG